MNDYEQKVLAFHKAFGSTVDEHMSSSLLELRKTLLFEEMCELFAEMDRAILEIHEHGAATPKTVSAMMKEMADVQYVLSGMAVTFGMPIDQAFDRVHNSNMSKLGPDGKPVLRNDGKIMKGPNYQPPDLSDLASDLPPSDRVLDKTA